MAVLPSGSGRQPLRVVTWASCCAYVATCQSIRGAVPVLGFLTALVLKSRATCGGGQGIVSSIREFRFDSDMEWSRARFVPKSGLPVLG